MRVKIGTVISVVAGIALSAASTVVAADRGTTLKALDTARIATAPALEDQLSEFLPRDEARSLVARCSGPLPPLRGNALTAGTMLTGLADFDGGLAPCSFSEINSFIGDIGDLQFFGSFGNGGGILDDCSGFGVAALSGNNFLAFDSTATLLNGKVPRFPQMIRGRAATIMGFSITSETPQEVTILAFTENGVTEVKTFMTNPGIWETQFAVTAGGVFFSAIVLLGSGTRVVIDDVFGLRF